MKITYTNAKNATPVVFTAGSLTTFDGTTLSISRGETLPLTHRKFILMMRKVVSTARANKRMELSLSYADIRTLASESYGDYEVGRVAATAFGMAAYEHNSYKTAPKGGFKTVEAMALLGAPKAAQEGCADGLLIANEINAARELSNMPGGDMTPKALATAAKNAVKGTSAKVTVLGEKEMTKLGMGAVLGVGRGAEDESQFIIVEYWGTKKSTAPVVIVGKGVTFDTGGQQAKGGDHMYEMHMDMSGGASAIHAVVLAAKMKLKVNAVALVPAVENATGPRAMRPGDILRSLSGKTIEIIHTDAEGRVIMADALTYAKRYKPALVADAATLTGASLTAFGEQASAFMTNREDMIADFQALAEESGDYMWPMPMWEEYDYIVKGRFGDVPNIPAIGNSRYAGVIGGGKFLEVFAKELDCPWIHVDMAPKMTAAPDEYLSKGAAGAPIRFFLSLLEKHAAA